MSRFVLLTALATTIHAVAFAQTPSAPVPPTPPAVAAQAAPPAPTSRQTPRPPTPFAPMPAVEPVPPAPPRVAFPATPTNVRLELVLTDSYSGSPVKKTVSMIVVLGQSGMIRSSSQIGSNVVELNVDAMARYWPNPTVNSAFFTRGAGGGARGGRGSVSGQNTATTPAPATAAAAAAAANDGDRPILLSLTLQYAPAGASTGPRPSALNQSLSVIVENGKPLVVSQSADPTSDRKVTVEVTATVLK